MKKILAFMNKQGVGVTMGVCSAGYLIYLGVSIALEVKRHKKEMETQQMIQNKIRADMAEGPKPEES